METIAQIHLQKVETAKYNVAYKVDDRSRILLLNIKEYKKMWI